jgi:hypothetical protein
MAVTELQGSHVGVYVRDYGSTSAFKRIVCEETLTLSLTNDVNTTKTKCGVFKGVDVTDWKINGNGVASFNPSGSEISANDLQTLQIARTKQEVFVQNESFSEGGTTYDIGEVFKFGGAAYLVAQDITFPGNDITKFTYNLEGVGTPDTTES